jgi:hypothetical protein
MKQVDVIALTRAEREAAKDLVELQAAYGDVPPDPEYWSSVLSAAHKLFKVDGIEEGFRVLAIVPPAYFRGPLVEQMEADEELTEKAKLIADKLLAAGRASWPGYKYDTTKTVVQTQFGRA